MGDQVRFADLAQEARLLRPHTLKEDVIRKNVHLVNERDEWDRLPWPCFGVFVGDLVQLNGLASRPDLESTTAVVADIEFRTRRIGVRLAADGALIYVVQERITPLARPAIVDEPAFIVPPPPAGDGGLPYDHAFFLCLQEKVLDHIRNTDCGELGVSFHHLAAAIEATVPWSSTDDIRVVLGKLVFEGEVYTTVDNHHFVAL